MKYNKYKNKKTKINDIIFDSRKEGEYYLFLKNAKKFKKIKNFEMQKKYILIPKQIDKITGKFLEHPVTYKADFTVLQNNGTIEVIDVKGFKTDVYRIKKKLMLYVHGIRIIEK